MLLETITETVCPLPEMLDILNVGILVINLRHTNNYRKNKKMKTKNGAEVKVVIT